MRHAVQLRVLLLIETASINESQHRKKCNADIYDDNRKVCIDKRMADLIIEWHIHINALTSTMLCEKKLISLTCLVLTLRAFLYPQT